MTLKNEIRERIANLRMYEKDGKRAPHKTLLILLAFSHLVKYQSRILGFREIEKELGDLLEVYGSNKGRERPQYPFWRLRTDRLWEIEPGGKELPVNKSGDPSVTMLRKKNVQAGFPEPIFKLFQNDRDFMDEITRTLLTSYFSNTAQDEIPKLLGLYYTVRQGTKEKRDPAFRKDVIQVYNHRCAICGYDLKMDNTDLALEAAHIQWRAYGGPDAVNNGMALCSIHHVALDRGAIGLSENHKIMISRDLHGSTWIQDLFLRFDKETIMKPQSDSMLPSGEYIDWHTKRVFREPVRG